MFAQIIHASELTYGMQKEQGEFNTIDGLKTCRSFENTHRQSSHGIDQT